MLLCCKLKFSCAVSYNRAKPLTKAKRDQRNPKSFYFFLFYLYIYPHDSKESDGGANT